MTFLALLPAAGRGERFGGGTPKQFLRLGKRTVLEWSVERLLRAGARRVVVALPKDRFEWGKEALARLGPVFAVAGGATRQASVGACLASTEGAADELILVHDAARPGVAVEDIEATVRAAAQHGGAILGRPVADTLKRVDNGLVQATVERQGLFRAETPQVFRRQFIEAAMARAQADGFEGTDEASLVERLGEIEIAAVIAKSPNPKLTEVADLELLRKLLG